ncbi:hypothetical protein IAD21_06441 (plasmid) [Abditibacteriota bacterium]|nr:hypothetical protein IAD21_06441 [Abditibacteriota bacterium]
MVAFGVRSYATSELPGRVLYFGTSRSTEVIHFEIESEHSVFWSIEIGEGLQRTTLAIGFGENIAHLTLKNPNHKALLAQSLYCLDFNQSNPFGQ